MCGINGLLFKTPQSSLSERLEKMNNSIIHRGPDDHGHYIFGDKLAMGMRRLSIIDLEHGKQPIFSDDRELVIVFNGEIYNYRELKQSLEQDGVQFKTQSDTEVVLRLYEKYGKDCLQMLNGMFGFSIHDKKKNELFIARDRFGEKPLYYSAGSAYFTWASELKSMVAVFPELKKIDPNGLTLFFSLTYIPAPHTIYKNVSKLKAGHYLVVNTTTLAMREEKYWDIDLQVKVDPQLTYEKAKAELRELLFESVEKRMIADVPLGVFLSGGVDSTIIAAIMSKLSDKKVKTFSVGYANKKYDESDRARIVANHIGSEHHEYILDYNDLFDRVDEIVLNYDEPYADSSCLPTYFVSSKTAKEVKVALTGDGGDEVFGGYNKYMAIGYREKYQRYVPRFVQNIFSSRKLTEKLLGGHHTKSVFTKAKKFLHSVGNDAGSGHLNIIALGFQQTEVAELLSSPPQPNYKQLLEHDLGDIRTTQGNLKLVRYMDKNISLEGDMLAKVDRASMLCSLECRAPFLDHRLMELTYRLPDHFLLKGSNKKRILKDTFADLLPADFFNAPKSGFEIPVGEWFRGEMKQELEQTLSPGNLEKHHLFNAGYVSDLIATHLSGKADHSWKLWTLFCFQKWYNKNFN